MTLTPQQRRLWIDTVQASQRSGASILEMLDERRASNAARGQPPYIHDQRLRESLEPWLEWSQGLLDALQAGLDEPDLPVGPPAPW